MPTCLPVTSSALPLTHHSAINNSSKQLRCYSSNPNGYISRPIGPRVFSIASAPASTTSPPHKSSPHHCLLPLDVPCQMRRLVPEVPRVCLPRGHKFLLRKSACPAPNVPAKRPQFATLQDHPVPVTVATSSRPCGAASCSCEPQLSSGTTVPTRDWTPLWHGFGSSLWRKFLLLPPCAT